MAIEVKPLTSSTKSDFFRMREHESCNWCFCVAWHMPTWEGWPERTAEQNRTLREELFTQGKYDGYLLYMDNKPVGWCQCAPLEWFPKLIQQFGLNEEQKGTYVIGCLEILPEYRKKGLSRVLLDGVLTDLKRRGISRVVAIPRKGKHEDGAVWTGPSSLFESRSFKAIKSTADRHVMVLELDHPAQVLGST